MLEFKWKHLPLGKKAKDPYEDWPIQKLIMRIHELEKHIEDLYEEDSKQHTKENGKQSA